MVPSEIQSLLGTINYVQMFSYPLCHPERRVCRFFGGGVYPERYEILPLHFVQGFGSHAQNDNSEGLPQNDTRMNGYNYIRSLKGGIFS